MAPLPYSVDVKHLSGNDIQAFTFMPATREIVYRYPNATNRLLIFSASWCHFCQDLQRNLIAMEKKVKGKIPLAMVDIDRAPEILRAFKATGYTIPHYPTIYVIQAVTGKVLQPMYDGNRDPDSLIRLVCARSSLPFSSSSVSSPSLLARLRYGYGRH